MKKWMKIVVVSVAFYIFLVLMLMLSERSGAGAIHSLGDAVWYSLVTMTTVGYGDIYPVTIGGKLIGSIFMLASLGLLAFVVNAVFSLMTGKWILEYKLWRMRKRSWFIMSERNQDSDALAENLLKNHPEALILFCACSDIMEGNKVAIKADVLEWIPKNRFQKGIRNIFMIGEDEGKNRLAAAKLSGGVYHLYCKSIEVDSLPEVTFFDSKECCARSFWINYPLGEKEQRVVLIGDGDYAKALFHQAVLANCMTPFRKIIYQLRGDWSTYRQMHPGLSVIFEENPSEESASEKDSLYFEEKIWNSEQLLVADRIILCSDDFEKNAQRAIKMQRRFAIRGEIYVLGDDITAPGICFGKKKELFTEELVMKQEQDQIARDMHEAYRISVNGNAPAWSELNSFLRTSNRAVADHIPIKVQMLREYGKAWEDRDEVLTEMCRKNEHERWCHFHYLYNWSYASVRDNRLRKHPCLVPYEQLTTEEQMKDDLAWEQIAVKKK